MKNMKLTYDNCYELYLLLDNLPDMIHYNKVFLLYVKIYKELLLYPFEICSSLKESFGTTLEFSSYYKQVQDLNENNVSRTPRTERIINELNEEFDSCIKEHEDYHAYISGFLQNSVDLYFPLIQNKYFPDYLTDVYDKLSIFLEVPHEKNNS